jgi:hypothetical protein
MTDEPIEPRIVEAVGTAASSAKGRPGLAEFLEQVMASAVQQALDEGVPMSDADEIRRRTLEARRKALEEYRAPRP